MRPRLLIFAGGTSRGGGSGFENYVTASRSDQLDADVVGVVSSHERGGVRERAKRLGVRFAYLSKDFHSESAYRALCDVFKPDYIALSGWLLKTQGLDPRTTFNIHSAPLPQFGGMYGKKLREAVYDAFCRGEIEHTAVNMHFVTDEYDAGPVFFSQPVPIHASDTPETLQLRVQRAEHLWQPRIAQLVVSGKITWDGKEPSSLTGDAVH